MFIYPHMSNMKLEQPSRVVMMMMMVNLVQLRVGKNLRSSLLYARPFSWTLSNM